MAPMGVETMQCLLSRLRVHSNGVEGFGPSRPHLINKTLPDKLGHLPMIPADFVKHHLIHHDPDMPQCEPPKKGPVMNNCI